MNPKVGTNTTMTVLYRLAGLADGDVGNPHQTSRDQDLLARHGLQALDIEPRQCQTFFGDFADYYTFSFTRNPFTRLRSAYNDKLKRYAELACPELLVELAKVDGVDKTKKYYQAELKSRIGFEQFVGDVCTRYLHGDQHWLPQYDRLRPDLCRYNLLGKLENFPGELTRALVEMGVDKNDHPRMPAPLNTATVSPADQTHYSPSMAQQVCAAFRKDFDEFDYQTLVSGI